MHILTIWRKSSCLPKFNQGNNLKQKDVPRRTIIIYMPIIVFKLLTKSNILLKVKITQKTLLHIIN